MRNYNKTWFDKHYPDDEKQDVIIRYGNMTISNPTLPGDVPAETYTSNDTITAYVTPSTFEYLENDLLVKTAGYEIQFWTEKKEVRQVKIGNVEYAVKKDKIGQGYSVLWVIEKK